MKRITWITLCVSIAACSSSSTSTPTPADYDDAAQTIATSTVVASGTSVGAGEVVAMGDVVGLALGRLPLGFLRSPDGRVTGRRMGVDHTFTITCKDAAGTVLAACDRTTDSATVEVKFSGMLQTPNLTASIDRQGTWTITGLQSGTATINGDSSLSLDTTLTSIFRQGVTSTFTLDATAAYDAITVVLADRQVTGGSASFEVKVHRTVTGAGSGKDVDRSFDVTAVLTFHADHTATLVLDGTHTFTIDLTTGRVTRVN